MSGERVTMGVADTMIRALGGGKESSARRPAKSGRVEDLWEPPPGSLSLRARPGSKIGGFSRI